MVSYTLHQSLARLCALAFSIALFLPISLSAQSIPLPEHPRPDFERPDCINLNGTWAFEFDKNDQGLTQKWMNGSRKSSLALARELLGQAAIAAVQEDGSDHTTPPPTFVCWHCGHAMVILQTFTRSHSIRAPPAGRTR